MNNLPNIKTPAESVAQIRKANYDLSNHGIENLRLVYWNLPMETLYEEAVFHGEGVTAIGGQFVVNTGKHTARAAKDKFTVRESASEEKIWWGQYNQPFSAEKFSGLHERMLDFIQGRDVFVQDVYVGEEDKYRLPVRVVTELAWHSMFARNMFLLPQSLEEYKRFVPEFTILAIPSFKATPALDNTNSETFICLSYEKKLVIIGNTAYAGEIKKSAFTIMNYLLPLEGVLSMHCSANVSPKDMDNVALFFGLSGTGRDNSFCGTDTPPSSETMSMAGATKAFSTLKTDATQKSSVSLRLPGRKFMQPPKCSARSLKMCLTIHDSVLLISRMTRDRKSRASYPLEFIDNAVVEKMAGIQRMSSS